MTQHSADSEIRTKGSLCSGTGALDAATPGELRWVAETNPAAVAILGREHPYVPNFGDITKIGGLPEDDQVDLITSGDPCQSMSAAGRQMASADERFLWPDVLRVIRSVRPRHLFLENVSNLTSVALVKGAEDWRGQKGSVLKLRLDDLREAGYAVKWTVLGACAVGAPHHRHRWFLRAVYVGQGAPEAIKIESKCGAPRSGGRALLPTPRATDIGTPGRRSSEGWRPQLGQAVLETWGKFAEAVALWETIIGRPAPDPTEPAPRGGRRLNAALSEWMMGYPAGYLTRGGAERCKGGHRTREEADRCPADHIRRNEALRMAGNGVVALQARTAWEQLA